jgi:sugar/nucleoside kinase (ribokinase family)
LGDDGSEIYQNHKKIKIGIYRVRKTIDPTGAGDAYRAGFLYGFLNHYSLADCGRLAAATASFAVEVKGTMNKKFNKKLLLNRFVKVKTHSFSFFG